MANTSKRGFASMDNEKQRIIASKGGKAAHAKGTAHEWSSDEARAAGRKGGESRGTRNRNQNQTLTALSSAPNSGAFTNNTIPAGSNGNYGGNAAFLNDAGSSLRKNEVGTNAPFNSNFANNTAIRSNQNEPRLA